MTPDNAVGQLRHLLPPRGRIARERGAFRLGAPDLAEQGGLPHLVLGVLRLQGLDPFPCACLGSCQALHLGA